MSKRQRFQPILLIMKRSMEFDKLQVSLMATMNAPGSPRIVLLHYADTKPAEEGDKKAQPQWSVIIAY